MAGVDEYVQLLVQSNGINGSTSFSDTSGNGRTVTPTSTSSGTVTHSNAYSRLQDTSIRFYGLGRNYLIVPTSTDFNCGTGDFTIDFSVALYNTNTVVRLFEKGWYVGKVNGYARFYDSLTGVDLLGTTTLGYLTWHHIAVVRYGNVWTLYVDGVAEASTTNSNALYDYGSDLDIGDRFTNSPSSTTAVYLDEVRFSVGVARWTANFTPPTEAYSSDILQLVMVGDGGGVVGGSASITLDPENRFGGAVAGGSAPVETESNTPTHHWTFDNYTEGATSSEYFDEIGDISILAADPVSGLYGLSLPADAVSGTRPLVTETLPRGTAPLTTWQSISLWFSRGSLVNHCTLLTGYDGSRLGIDYTTGYLFFYSPVDGVVTTDLSIPVSEVDVWHHLVLIRGSADYYFDLVLDGDWSGDEYYVRYLNVVSYFSQDWTSAASYHHAGMDNIQVYNRQLDADEVDYLLNAQSQNTTLPRLPFYIHTSTGGAVAGGDAGIKIAAKVVVAEGGAVAGGTGSGVGWRVAEIDGNFPRLAGAGGLLVSGVANIAANFPRLAGSIDTGWYVAGNFPRLSGEITLLQTHLANVSGNIGRLSGSITADVSILAGFEGNFPRLAGNIETFETNLCDIVGYFPRLTVTGTIYHTGCTITGAFPSLRGRIKAVYEQSVSLAFSRPAYGDGSGTTPADYSSFVLEKTKTNWCTVEGNFPRLQG